MQRFCAHNATHCHACDDCRFKPPPADIVSRLQQRSDDTEEKCRARLKTHNDNVAAVLGYYTKEMVTVDGDRSMDAVFSSIEEILTKTQAANGARKH